MNYIGAAYYPELWDESEIDRDIEQMKAHGMNVMRIGEFAWSKMEPREGEIDLSFLTSRFAPVRKAIEDAACELIKAVDVVDIYEAGDASSIAVRLTFSDNKRTLTREEVAAVTDRIVADLEKAGIKLKM